MTVSMGRGVATFRSPKALAGGLQLPLGHPLEPHVQFALHVIAETLFNQGRTPTVFTKASGGSFKNVAFSMHGFCPCDQLNAGHEQGCPPNFQAGDFKVYWEPRLSIATLQSQALDIAACAKVLQACIASLKDA